MIRFISFLQVPTVSIYPVVQKTKFVFLRYETNNNGNNNNNNNNNNNKIKAAKIKIVTLYFLVNA